MRRIISVVLCLIWGVLIVSCSAQQKGQTRLLDVARFKTGMAYGLVVQGNYAYITTNSELVIVDVTNPDKLVKVVKEYVEDMKSATRI